MEDDEFISLLCHPKKIATIPKNDIDSYSNKILRVVDNGNWKLFLDDFWFKLYHETRNNKRFESLVLQYDLFYFAIGDASADYVFAYYMNGKCIRKVSVRDEWDHGVIAINEGVPLPVEIPLLTSSHEMVAKMILDVANYFGIDTKIEEMKYYRWED